MYTLIVSPLTESVASAVGHALYPAAAVPSALDVHQYTPFQRHMRPLELLLLGGVTWWSLNRSNKPEEMMRLNSSHAELKTDSQWDVLKAVAPAVGVAAGYLLILAISLSLLKPQGLAWTLSTVGAGMAAGTLAFFLAKRAGTTRLDRRSFREE